MHQFLLLLLTNVVNINGFYVSLNSFEWQQARSYCINHCKSDLVSIHNNDEYQQLIYSITNITKNINYEYAPFIYIGLNDVNASGIYEWSDGSITNNWSYPWDTSEPNSATQTEHCVALKNDNYKFTLNDCYAGNNKNGAIDNYIFVCNHCNGILTKYVIINDNPSDYYDQKIECSNIFGTGIASIHSNSDMNDSYLLLTLSQMDDWGTFSAYIGLYNYVWDDGTKFDYGGNIAIKGVYPWAPQQPDNSGSCVWMKSNGLWYDELCNIQLALCNAPSQICHKTQWNVINGIGWIWNVKPCQMSNDLTMTSIAIISGKRWYNGNKSVVVEYMYTMNGVDTNFGGIAGIIIHIDTSCNHYYYVAISSIESMVYIYESWNNILNVVGSASLTFSYQIGTFYLLRIEITINQQFRIFVNNVLYIDINSDLFDNIGNMVSGYIGIRNINCSIIAKSLFVSGTVIDESNMNINSTQWFSQCTISSTTEPTTAPLSISKYQTVTKLVTLSPDHTEENGASVTMLKDVLVDVTHNVWNFDVTDNIGWHLMVNLNNSWGFHSDRTSTTTLIIDSNDIIDSSIDLDLSISFSVGNIQYLSLYIRLDNDNNNRIYPQCTTNVDTSITSLGNGDVVTLVNMDNADRRNDKVGDNYGDMYPLANGQQNGYPLIFKLTNYPSNWVNFTYRSDTFNTSYIQQCLYESFDVNQGMQIYIGFGNNERGTIKSFTVRYEYDVSYSPTATPTISPTDQPTDSPITNIATTNNPTIYNSITTVTTTTEFIEDAEVVNNNNNNDDKLSVLYNITFTIFVVLIIMIGFFGFLDANCWHKNDLFNISCVIIFGLYSIDFLSDLFFAATVFDHNLIIFICSCLFLLVPLIFNLLQLRKEIICWIKDNENGLMLVTYIDENSKFLYILTMISGSGFAAVKLLNSGLFRMKIFDMRLKKDQMRSFQNKRIFSVVLVENIPQIILQTIFAIISDKMYAINIMALIFSIFSIILSIFEYSTKKSINRHNSVYCDIFTIKIDVISSEVMKNRNSLKYRRLKMNAKIAEILQIDQMLVEQLSSMEIDGGLQLWFRVKIDYVHRMSTNTNNISKQQEIINILNDKIQDGSLTESIKNSWKLKAVPLIKNLAVLEVKEDITLPSKVQMNTIS